MSDTSNSNNSSIISAQALAIVKATAPLVKEHATAITSVFYPKMLGRHPELYRYFNESNQVSSPQKPMASSNGSCPFHQPSSAPPKLSKQSQQAKTLADAVVAYALNIEHLEHLTETVIRICHKHCALGIQPEDYQIVHDNLLEAIGEVLGDAVTPAVAAAWSEAVMALAKLFIEKEAQLYDQAALKQWTGPRDFVITDIIQESADIKSFRMVPSDGQGTCPFQPGQYISIFEKPEGKQYFAPRHYTLTSQPGDDYYQVSIKKVATTNAQHPPGIMSNYMHSKQVGDTVQLDLFLAQFPCSKVLLIALRALFWWAWALHPPLRYCRLP